MDSVTLGRASRWSAVAAAALLVAVAWAFLPIAGLPSFDVPKLALLVVGAIALTLWAGRRRGTDAAGDLLQDPILALLLLAALVSALVSLADWPRGTLLLPVLAIACVAVARVVARSDDPRAAVRVVARGAAVAAAGAGAYALVQRAGLDPAPWGGRREVVATFGNPSFAAEFQAAALPFAAFLVAAPGLRRGDRVLGAAAALLAAAHLVLARSRIDLLAAGAGLSVAAVVLLHATGRRRAAWVLAGAGGAAAVAAGAAFAMAAAGDGPAWVGRSATLEVRARIWRATTRMIADAPFRIAAAPFSDLFPAWRSAEEYRISLGRSVETPHNDVLAITASLGIWGLLLALATLVLIARRVLASTPDGQATGTQDDAAGRAALAGVLAALVVSGLASSPLSHPATALLGAVAAGLVVGLRPRPAGWLRLPARAMDVGLAATLALAVWPGPVLRTLRSDGFVALARQEVEIGDTARALELLDVAAAVDPQAFEARRELGILFHAAGQPAAGVAALRSAHRLRPGNLETRVSLAYALRSVGRADEAQELIAESLALCPWHPHVRTARASFLLVRGQADAALADPPASAALLPHDPRIAAVAMEARLVLDPSPETRESALDALETLRAAGDAVGLDRAARAFLLRDPGLLGPLVTRARRLAPTAPDSAAALVLAAATGAPQDAGFLEEASTVLRRAGRLEPSAVLLGRSLGIRAREAYEAGDDEQAASLAQKAAAREPRPEHHLVAARALTRLGERKAAGEQVAAALAAGPLDPDDVRRDAVLATLFPDRGLEGVLDRAAKRRR